MSEPSPDWTPVGRVEEFTEGVGRLVHIGARRIGIYRHQGRWFALKDTCPHRSVALHRGPIVDGAVMCTGHGWTFDLATGLVRHGDQGFRVAAYPVRENNGVVEVGV
jgi:nitrite reductase (NADH) small subunit